MQPQPECNVRAILYSRYIADRRVYMEAARDLGLGDENDFERSYDTADRKRIAFEVARDRLRKHCAEHGCALPEGV